ncbi:MAG: hypothetical protein A2289_05645 [Deltaproteobacteria bacterium RIFOXYA12_FULL_58_15]|nr:MAG: hypothetical protein A2289_05645 [Deltaproteobacteria bacterium RIFOXYA12_FULL_58_15]
MCASATSATSATSTASTAAGKNIVAFEQRKFVHNGSELRFFFAAPVKVAAKAEEDVTYPVLLFLHSAGSRGARHGEHIAHITEFLRVASLQHPMYVVAPVVPRGELWATYGWSTEHSVMQAEPTDNLLLTRQLLNQLQAELPIDTERIYVTGVSMGGYGTWEAVQRWPGDFAAAVPICGGGDPTRANTLVNMPIWAFHGIDDDVVPVAETRQMIEAIRRGGGEPRYTEYPAVNHAAWEPAYREPGLIEWLFTQRKTVPSPQ